MKLVPLPPSINLNPSVENKVRDDLHSYFAPSYRERVHAYVETLLMIEHYLGRFQYLFSIIGSANIRPNASILISGCGAGSEMLAARQFNFGKIHAVEVEKIWTTICQERLSYLPEMYTLLYGGDYLPYADNQFEVIASGHVIEHTANPSLYIRECIRTLAPGGYLALEFPSRYHYKELHTQLPSFEWLPTPIRNAMLKLASDPMLPIPLETKSRYRSILTTNLQQISVGGIKAMLKQSGYRGSIIHSRTVAPGIIRCVIQKSLIAPQ